jgi:translation initiation factor IF-1
VKVDAAGQTAIVVELLPSAAYRLKLENEDLEVSPHDRTRGRIVELLTKG